MNATPVTMVAAGMATSVSMASRRHIVLARTTLKSTRCYYTQLICARHASHSNEGWTVHASSGTEACHCPTSTVQLKCSDFACMVILLTEERAGNQPFQSVSIPGMNINADSLQQDVLDGTAPSDMSLAVCCLLPKA